jgi:hypothetical protein
MLLHTYIVSYQVASRVTQGRHSNFKGFISSWGSDIPAGALPALTPSLKKKLTSKAYGGDFAPIPNVQHAWRKTLDVGGAELSVIAIQTQP